MELHTAQWSYSNAKLAEDTILTLRSGAWLGAVFDYLALGSHILYTTHYRLPDNSCRCFVRSHVHRHVTPLNICHSRFGGSLVKYEQRRPYSLFATGFTRRRLGVKAPVLHYKVWAYIIDHALTTPATGKLWNNVVHPIQCSRMHESSIERKSVFPNLCWCICACVCTMHHTC